MAINIATKAILKILSFGGIDVEVSRQLADLKRLDPMKIFYKKMDLQVYNGDQGTKDHAFPSRRRMGD